MIDLRPVALSDLAPLFSAHHAYKDSGKVAVYAFAVFEDDRIVAGFAWQPPPPGAAKSVCPECPSAVLVLSRMVAVPQEFRRLKKISKALRLQRDTMIDRERWPVLISYSDEGVINERGTPTTGNCYLYSGFSPTSRSKANQYAKDGRRTSPYANGKFATSHLTKVGTAYIQRWEHWINIVPYRNVAEYLAGHGWSCEKIPGKTWRSGKQAHRWVHRAEPAPVNV